MKKNSYPAILLGLVALSAILSCGLCLAYMSNAREFRTINGQVALINSQGAKVNQLVADMLEYSKRNPAIDPLLESINAKPKGAAAAKPATK